MSAIASIASATGTTRGQMHGSWRPSIAIVVVPPAAVAAEGRTWRLIGVAVILFTRNRETVEASLEAARTAPRRGRA